MNKSVKGLVSIVVASYNYDDLLKQRIEGLLQQSYENFEIIVIDDASIDNSKIVLREFVHNKRIRIIENQVNSGWVAVSNQGIAESKGEYIMFANCDDLADKDLIKSLVAPLVHQGSVGMTFCRSSMINDIGVRTNSDFSYRNRSFKQFCNQDAYIPKQVLEKFLIHSCVVPNLSGALLRRDVLELVGGFSYDYRICSDWDLFFKISKFADASYVSAELNSFRQHQRTIRKSSNATQMLTEICELLDKQAEKFSHLSLRLLTYKRIGELILIEILDPRKFNLKDFNYYIRLLQRLNRNIVRLLPVAFVGVGIFGITEILCRSFRTRRNS